jgi:hypothetical protein
MGVPAADSEAEYSLQDRSQPSWPSSNVQSVMFGVTDGGVLARAGAAS